MGPSSQTSKHSPAPRFWGQGSIQRRRRCVRLRPKRYSGSHRPRCFGGPTGCPLAGPCLRRVQGSVPYRLQVSDLRRRLTDRASEVSAQPDQTQGFVHARQELPDSQLLDSGYRFLILLPPPTGVQTKWAGWPGRRSGAHLALEHSASPRRPSALHCANVLTSPPLPLPKLGRTNSSPPPSPVLRPARARALFGAPCLSQRNPRHSCCIVSCRVRAAPAIPLPRLWRPRARAQLQTRIMAHPEVQAMRETAKDALN